MRKFLLLFALAIAVMTSCVKEELYLADQGNGEVVVTSTLSSSKVSGDAWVIGDQIGLYMIDAAVETNTCYNFAYKAKDSGATTTFQSANDDNTIYFPQSEDNAVVFYAYYPYNEDANELNSIVTVDVKDQADSSDFADLDFMVAESKSVTRSSSSIDLNFHHKMAKIEITLDTDEESVLGFYKGATLEVTNAYSQGLFNATDYEAEVSTTGDIAASIPFYVKSAETFTKTVEGLMIPQTITAGTSTVVVWNNGSEYVADFPSDVTLKSGYVYKYALTIREKVVSLSDPEIKPWEDGGDYALGVYDDTIWNGLFPNSELEAINYLGEAVDGVYQIRSAMALASVAYLTNLTSVDSDEVEFGDKSYMLQANLDMGGYNWTPIGEYSDAINYFGGTFDGNDYTIDNLYVPSTSTETGYSTYRGLFGWCEAATIQNVTLGSKCIVYAAGAYSSPLVAYLNGGYVYNCVSNALITSTASYVGGIVGGMAGINVVEGCRNYGAVTSSSTYVGGIVGNHTSTTIVANCINEGAISASSLGGGISSNLTDEGGIIINCMSTDLTGNGGIVATSTAAGVVAAVYSAHSNVVLTETAAVADTVAYSATELALSTASDVVLALNNYTAAINREGTYDFDLYSWYVDESTSAPAINWGVASDLVLESADDVWDGTYPEDEASAISVLASVESEISTPAELAALAYLVNSGNTDYAAGTYTLTKSFSLDNQAWTPIGSAQYPFTGTFDGGDWYLYRLTIDGDTPQFTGLFGYSTGTIKNLNVTGDVTSSYPDGFVAGLVGCNDGIIMGCTNEAVVTATANNCLVAGIAAYSTGNISTSANKGTITGAYAGGIVAVAQCNIKACYNTGEITSTSALAGGIVASVTSGNLYNNYNLGDVSSASVAGGLVGSAVTSHVYNNYNNGNVTATDYAGGIAGVDENAGVYILCYNSGEITATTIGGILGTFSLEAFQGPTVQSSYSTVVNPNYAANYNEATSMELLTSTLYETLNAELASQLKSGLILDTFTSYGLWSWYEDGDYASFTATSTDTDTETDEEE